jgi:hypothetical protein
MPKKSNTRISFAKSYPKTWFFLKHIGLPVLAGGLTVGIVIATGGAASLPLFAIVAAKIGLGGLYAVLGIAAGLTVAWFRNVISDIRKQAKASKPIIEEIKVSKLSKESVFQAAPPTLQKELSSTSKVANVFGPVVLYPKVERPNAGTLKFMPVAVALPTIVEEPTRTPTPPPQVDAVKIKVRLMELAERVVDLLDKQGEKLLRLLPHEVRDANEFMKKYSDEYDLQSKLNQYQDKFRTEVDYMLTVGAYQEFRQLAKSERVQQLRSELEVVKVKQQEAIAKREQAQADERRSKMGMSLHPLSDD